MQITMIGIAFINSGSLRANEIIYFLRSQISWIGSPLLLNPI